MYLEFMQTVAAYMRALNTVACEARGDALIPYLDRLPVLVDGLLYGFMDDEVGGSFSYMEATDEEREWWSDRPWRVK